MKSLYELLKNAFSLPKEKQKYLVVLRERCPFIDDKEGIVYIVESEGKVKRGMNHSYPCEGYNDSMTDNEILLCKKCGFKRVRYIDAVDSYSYKKAKSLRAESGTKSLKDIL